MTLRFAKGHGTENDFVIVPDFTGELTLSSAVVRQLCNRRTGIGADGVLRVVRPAHDPDAAAYRDDADWFMDYRNADGSVAEMCGNGIRVLARYLAEQELLAGAAVRIATRGGIREVTFDDSGDITVDMGTPQVGEESSVLLGMQRFAGTVVFAPNPHLVCVTSTPVDAVDFATPPVLDSAAFPHGANVEIVNAVGPDRLRLRVYERGSGETRSCGTGVLAAGALARPEPGSVRVSVPGGELRVTRTASTCLLSGPAVIVAEGHWLAREKA